MSTTEQQRPRPPPKAELRHAPPRRAAMALAVVLRDASSAGSSSCTTTEVDRSFHTRALLRHIHSITSLPTLEAEESSLRSVIESNCARRRNQILCERLRDVKSIVEMQIVWREETKGRSMISAAEGGEWAHRFSCFHTECTEARERRVFEREGDAALMAVRGEHGGRIVRLAETLQRIQFMIPMEAIQRAAVTEKYYLGQHYYDAHRKFMTELRSQMYKDLVLLWSHADARMGVERAELSSRDDLQEHLLQSHAQQLSGELIAREHTLLMDVDGVERQDRKLIEAARSEVDVEFEAAETLRRSHLVMQIARREIEHEEERMRSDVCTDAGSQWATMQKERLDDWHGKFQLAVWQRGPVTEVSPGEEFHRNDILRSFNSGLFALFEEEKKQRLPISMRNAERTALYHRVVDGRLAVMAMEEAQRNSIVCTLNSIAHFEAAETAARQEIEVQQWRSHVGISLLAEALALQSTESRCRSLLLDSYDAECCTFAARFIAPQPDPSRSLALLEEAEAAHRAHLTTATEELQQSMIENFATGAASILQLRSISSREEMLTAEPQARESIAEAEATEWTRTASMMLLQLMGHAAGQLRMVELAARLQLYAMIVEDAEGFVRDLSESECSAALREVAAGLHFEMERLLLAQAVKSAAVEGAVSRAPLEDFFCHALAADEAHFRNHIEIEAAFFANVLATVAKHNDAAMFPSGMRTVHYGFTLSSSDDGRLLENCIANALRSAVSVAEIQHDEITAEAQQIGRVMHAELTEAVARGELQRAESAQWGGMIDVFHRVAQMTREDEIRRLTQELQCIAEAQHRMDIDVESRAAMIALLDHTEVSAPLTEAQRHAVALGEGTLMAQYYEGATELRAQEETARRTATWLYVDESIADLAIIGAKRDAAAEEAARQADRHRAATAQLLYDAHHYATAGGSGPTRQLSALRLVASIVEGKCIAAPAIQILLV